MIVLDKVKKNYGEFTVLSDITFAVHPNEFVIITGPSGAGKSTLMHLLIGAEKVTDGQMNIDGVDLRKVPKKALQLYRRRVGMVFQDYKLLWNRTVSENIAFPLEICGASDKVITSRVDELLKQLKLEDIADSKAFSLSGGEKARTAIARALVHKPMILLADEPTGNLSPEESMEVMQVLKQVHSDGATVLLATHDTDLINALSARVIRLEDGVMMDDSAGMQASDVPPEQKGGEGEATPTADGTPAPTPPNPEAQPTTAEIPAEQPAEPPAMDIQPGDPTTVEVPQTPPAPEPQAESQPEVPATPPPEDAKDPTQIELPEESDEKKDDTEDGGGEKVKIVSTSK